MNRTIATVAVAGVFALAGGGIASAGEYNGKGGAVPGGVNGKSECSYSGLDVDDEIEGNPDGFDDDEILPRHVQSYGQLVSVGLKDFLPHPGQACRGNNGG